jgi:competence protein ComEA
MSLTRIGILVVVLVAAVGATFALFQIVDDRAAPPIIIEDAAANLPVVVDVRGAVATPGVYELAPGARVQDAITAAGGLAANADLSTINLARRLRDGEVIHFALVPEPGASPPAVAPVADDDANTPTRININTASPEELDLLPGIGEVTAARIIAFREENGPYHSVDDLILVEGISANIVAAFRDLVTTAP